MLPTTSLWQGLHAAFDMVDTVSINAILLTLLVCLTDHVKTGFALLYTTTALFILGLLGTFLIRNSFNAGIAGTGPSSLKLVNPFTDEKAINECNNLFLKWLLEYAERGEGIKLADFISRYAFDVLFVIMTEKRAGFLDKGRDAAQMVHAMEKRKEQPGFFTRFTSLVAKLVRSLCFSTDFERTIFDQLNILPDRDFKRLMDKLLQNHGSDLFTCQGTFMSTLFADANAVITNTLSAFKLVYEDRDLLARLRREIVTAHLGRSPSLQVISNVRPDMPVLSSLVPQSLTESLMLLDTEIITKLLIQTVVNFDITMAPSNTISSPVEATPQAYGNLGRTKRNRLQENRKPASTYRKGQPAVRGPRAPPTNVQAKTAGWKDFAANAPTQYVADAKAAEEANAKKVTHVEPPPMTVKETFKCTLKKNPLIEEAKPEPEYKATIPPHLRRKMKRGEVAQGSVEGI